MRTADERRALVAEGLAWENENKRSARIWKMHPDGTWKIGKRTHDKWFNPVVPKPPKKKKKRNCGPKYHLRKPLFLDGIRYDYAEDAAKATGLRATAIRQGCTTKQQRVLFNGKFVRCHYEGDPIKIKDPEKYITELRKRNASFGTSEQLKKGREKSREKTMRAIIMGDNEYESITAAAEAIERDKQYVHFRANCEDQTIEVDGEIVRIHQKGEELKKLHVGKIRSGCPNTPIIVGNEIFESTKKAANELGISESRIRIGQKRGFIYMDEEKIPCRKYSAENAIDNMHKSW